MKKLIATTALGLSMLIAPHAFAYEVKSGDTMYKIARGHNMNLAELTKANPQIKNINLIYVGQTINTTATDTEIKEVSAETSEIDLLARIVRAEAKGEPYQGKVAVANVILNRVNSSSFPNTIREVIYQPGQFTPVANGAINEPADSESIRAANEAFSNDVTNGSLFFFNPVTSSSRWLDSRPTEIIIGNHAFKK